MFLKNCDLKVFFLIISLSIKFCFAEQEFYLSANKIIKNNKENTVMAQGSVEIQNKQIKIHTDALQYNTKKNEIILEGNIKILYENGSVVFAEKAILNKDLKSGIIKSLGVLMSDDSRLVASSAKKNSNKYKTVYKNISYSKCKNCENNKGTFWKINAKKATHLEKSKVILYEDVFLELLNLPVFYFPFFYHPDPSVARKTGLLAPSFSSSNVFGFSYEQPIFLNLSSNSDLTLGAKLTEKEGMLLKNTYRKDFSSGQLRFKSSATRGTKVRANEVTKKENRGHIDLNFASNIGNDYVAGANIKRASDKSYLSRYELSDGETLLTQNLFLEKENIYSNLSGKAFKFQSLSDDYLEDNLPFIRPVLVYNWNNLWNTNRSRNWTSSIKLKSITKKNENNTNAFYINNNIEKNYLTNNILLKNEIDLDLDFYNSKFSSSDYKNVMRFFPSFGLTASYPLVNYKNQNSILFEPSAQVIYTLDNNNEDKIKNEDSLEVELLSSNFFTKDKYAGDDRKEHGLRINYGVNLKFNGINGSTNTFLLGRSYQDKKQEQFDIISGFGNKHSDFVGNYTMYISKDKELYYDFRVSDSFDLNRNRIRTSFELAKNKIRLNYIQINNFASRNNSDTEQISYELEREIFENWQFAFAQHRDLAGARFSTPFKSTVGINFENDCALITFNVTRDKSNDIDIPSTTNYNFNINLF
ncbi:MAG: hypothetical protein CMJ13_08555 [Pelagibacterales bacterium]|nr:hypothetical protein [Pelagibacterales bacterium]